MHQAIELLMNEHRLIEKALASLETFATRVHEGAEADPATIAKFARFLRGFADKWHHGKEEDLLFVKMGDYGFSSEAGPIAVMLSEHVQGRAYTSELAGLGEATAALQGDERQAFLQNAVGYINLLRAHIQKEDNILYPMALRMVPPEELDALLPAYERFQKEAGDEGAPQSYHALAAELMEAYPPAE